jgi:hypothetical protein
VSGHDPDDLSVIIGWRDLDDVRAGEYRSIDFGSANVLAITRG